MAVSAVGGAMSLGQHLQIQGATQSAAPTKTQRGAAVDRDGDHDNSAALSDAAEGKGSKVNLAA